MNKNNLLFLIILTVIVFGISLGFVCANDNTTLNDNLTNHTQPDTSNIELINQDKSNITTNSSSFENEDADTINYLIKNKEKYDNIVKKSTKKDRTFKIGKYKLTISKNDYRKFLYAKFIDKYIKTGKNTTLLEKIFKIELKKFMAFSKTEITFKLSPYYGVTKKINKIITLKVGTIKDYKNKKIYFKNYKKAKKFNKQLNYPHKIKYDKKYKRYYITVEITTYKKIITKKARVYIALTYYDNTFELTTYTNLDHKYNPITTSIVRDYTIYKSSKYIEKLNKSKTKKYYTYY